MARRRQAMDFSKPNTTEFYEALPHAPGQPFMDNLDRRAEDQAKHAAIATLIIALLAAVLLAAVIVAGLSMVQ